jgi:hypothetical protein
MVIMSRNLGLGGLRIRPALRVQVPPSTDTALAPVALSAASGRLLAPCATAGVITRRYYKQHS